MTATGKIAMTNVPTILKLTGVFSLVLLAGAGRPAQKVATKPQSPAAPAVSMAKPFSVTDAPELLADDATTASAMIAPTAPVTSLKKLRTIRMEVTAYCPCKKCCGPNAQGLTASGNDVSYNNSRFVAADTDRLPFGTRLMIPGYDAAPVQVIDRGSAIKGHKLDVYFPTHEQALQWGRQQLDVTIVE